MSKPMLATQELYFNYPDGTKALQGLSTEVDKDKKIALLGANGTGKSTFLLHLIGILKPHQGQVFFKGQPLDYHRTALQALRSKVGFVFQDPDSQLFSASVFQEISFGPLNLGWNEGQVKQAVTAALEATGSLALKDRPTHALSYGQKKLISIAGVLAMAPEVIILDEPTASLDPQYTGRIIALLNKINQKGTTILMATHDVDLAYAWADLVIVMHQGKVIKQGDPLEIFSDQPLLNLASLAKPLVVDIFNQLQEYGYIPAGIEAPRSKDQLFAMLADYKPPS